MGFRVGHGERCGGSGAVRGGTRCVARLVRQLGLTELRETVLVGERREFGGVFWQGGIRKTDGGELLGRVGSRLTDGCPGGCVMGTGVVAVRTSAVCAGAVEAGVVRTGVVRGGGVGRREPLLGGVGALEPTSDFPGVGVPGAGIPLARRVIPGRVLTGYDLRGIAVTLGLGLGLNRPLAGRLIRRVVSESSESSVGTGVPLGGVVLSAVSCCVGCVVVCFVRLGAYLPGISPKSGSTAKVPVELEAE